MVAINPADSTIMQPDYAVSRSEKQQAASRNSPVLDTVEISDEAKQRFRAETANMEMLRKSHEGEEGGEDGSAWRLSSGLKDGTYTLKNGNVQKIVVDGDSLSIEEFKDGKLVKTVAGTITENGAVLDTEFYDSAGQVSQTIHTEIVEGEEKEGWTESLMEREIKWFEGGKLKGEMSDQMLLQTHNVENNHDEDTTLALKKILGRGTRAVNTDAEALAALATVEKHNCDYYAEIKEYGNNNQLAREISVQQTGGYEQLSNRSYEDMGDMGKRTTRELQHNASLIVQIKDYDAEGNLVRDAQFEDTEKDDARTDDGKQTQTVAVSWYSNGDLIKRSNGSMTLEETGALRLPDRPGFLKLFGLKDEEYLGNEPQSAMELMGTKIMTSSAEADFFLDGVAEHVNGGDYSTAKGISQYGENDRPYSISWTDEIYKDGDLVMRQKASESARESSFYQKERALLFRKTGALAENASPAVLRKSSHERETFSDGEMTSHQSMEAREWVDVHFEAADELKTTARYEQGLPGHMDTTVLSGTGGIRKMDPDLDAAASRISTEMELSLASMYDVISGLNEGEEDDSLGRRLHFDFKSRLAA